MQIAGSSSSFARDLERGDLSQLEWLDLCAHELELDGVAFDLRHFPRTDDEYLAQLKKTCADLALTVAAVSDPAFFTREPEPVLALALALGAPLVTAPAPEATGDAGAWGAFAGAAQRASAGAKRANVTLAVRNAGGTLCASGADLKRLAKDVDSAWLRFAPDVSAFDALDAAADVAPKTVLAHHDVRDPVHFATASDLEAKAVIAGLGRFRGFVVLDRTDGDGPRTAYHDAVIRFRAALARASLEGQ